MIVNLQRPRTISVEGGTATDLIGSADLGMARNGATDATIGVDNTTGAFDLVVTVWVLPTGIAGGTSYPNATTTTVAATTIERIDLERLSGEYIRVTGLAVDDVTPVVEAVFTRGG